MSTATLQTVPSVARTVFPARLVPGAQLRLENFTRKKAASAILDREIWKCGLNGESVQSAKRPAWQSFLEAVLPQPSTRNQRAWLATAVLADFLAIVLSFVICTALWQPIQPFSRSQLSALEPLIFYGIIFTLLGYSERLYHPEIMQNPQESLVLAKACAWSSALIFATLSLSPSQQARTWELAATILLSFLLMLAHRKRHAAKVRTCGGSGVRNVLIVGAGTRGRQLARHIDRHPVHRRIVRGFLDDQQPLGGDIHGRIQDLARVSRCQFIDEVIVTVPPASQAAREAIRQARHNHIDIKLAPDVFGVDPAEVSLERFGDVPLLNLVEERVPNVGLQIKRALDVVQSFLLLLFTAPAFALIAIAIKLDSPGPVFYCATRLGRKGQRFTCYKFRTMVPDADQLKEGLRHSNQREGAFFKIANDPRVTRVGRLLRRYSLDELPQLWNVFRGEMSLIGPRPHPVDDFQRYRLEDLQRLTVTPGLTGLWQVTARSDPSFERNMSLDRQYITCWNLWLDLKILCKTMRVVLRGEGT
jgi:exopolysaccharide biosynthesis polyprenyl glycosylphosphotransferase